MLESYRLAPDPRGAPPTEQKEQQMRRFWILLIAFALIATPVMAKKKAAEDPGSDEEQKAMSAATFSGLEWRLIGPAYNSGRVSDFAVAPRCPPHHLRGHRFGRVCGRPSTAARRGSRSSTTKDRIPSAASPSTPTIPTWCGSAPARTTASVRWPSATVSTRASTAARTGRTSGSKSPSTSA